MTTPSALRIWIGGALAAFIDGFLDGCPIGAPAGAGMAVANGNAYADLGGRHLAIEAAHILAVPFFSGLSDVRAYKKDSPFPNIFAPMPVLPSNALVTEPTKP